MMKKVQPAPVVASPPPKGNRFAALDNFSMDSSDSEHEEIVTEVKKVPDIVQAVKAIPHVEDDSFTFVSARKGNKKLVTDHQGWTKVQWNKPQFIDSDEESETEIKKELELEAREVEIPEDEDIPAPVELAPVEGFSSLLNRGKSASIWADKIKQSLDKAEGSRKNAPAPGIQPTEDFVAGLGRVSFFGPRQS